MLQTRSSARRDKAGEPRKAQRTTANHNRAKNKHPAEQKYRKGEASNAQAQRATKEQAPERRHPGKNQPSDAQAQGTNTPEKPSAEEPRPKKYPREGIQTRIGQRIYSRSREESQSNQWRLKPAPRLRGMGQDVKKRNDESTRGTKEKKRKKEDMNEETRTANALSAGAIVLEAEEAHEGSARKKQNWVSGRNVDA
ncbi:hypothetical protein C8R44DRAFT_747979 [Mycena epipterygia]|nr:hypothetical protein C8R44DRAFT_747979 [Mycena epipterygia]